jgi:hypothetical protein
MTTLHSCSAFDGWGDRLLVVLGSWLVTTLPVGDGGGEFVGWRGKHFGRLRTIRRFTPCTDAADRGVSRVGFTGFPAPVSNPCFRHLSELATTTSGFQTRCLRPALRDVSFPNPGVRLSRFFGLTAVSCSGFGSDTTPDRFSSPYWPNGRRGPHSVANTMCFFTALAARLPEVPSTFSSHHRTRPWRDTTTPSLMVKRVGPQSHSAQSHQVTGVRFSLGEGPSEVASFPSGLLSSRSGMVGSAPV